MTPLTRVAQLKGKTIAKTVLERGHSEQTGHSYVHIRQIEFTDGTILVCSVCETGSDYAITGNLFTQEHA